jgi:1-acyl-sn-glycerol-3-phosphate acyltransferase
MLWLRSLAFNIVMIVTAVIYSILAVTTIVLRPIDRYHVIKQWARFMVLCMRWICGIRYVVHGRERLPKGSAIILSKHQSAWETIAFQRIFPPQVWVLKRELLWLPFFGWGLAMTQPIAIDRKASRHALDQVVKQGSRRLQNGRWVVVFPEGSRMPVGTRGKYNPGGALLAARSGYPVVPVAHNAGRCWPPRSFIKYPGTIQVFIGPVIDPAGKTAKQITREAEDWIETTMQRL